MSFADNYESWIPLIIVFVVINFTLAEIARRKFEHFWFWVLAFNSLPLFAHAFYIYACIRDRHKKKEVSDIVIAISDPSPGKRGFADGSPVQQNLSVSVTPFSDPGVSDTGRQNSTSSARPDYAIDDLIDRQLWREAFILALEHLDLLRSSDDQKSIDLYENYIQQIKPHLDENM